MIKAWWKVVWQIAGNYCLSWLSRLNSTTQTLGVKHLQNVSGKFCWKVNGTRFFVSFQRKISGSNGTSEKVKPCFSGRTILKGKFEFHVFKAIFNYPVFATVFRSMELIDMVNAIPGRNLPVLNFAYYLLKNVVCPLFTANMRPWTQAWKQRNSFFSWFVNLFLGEAIKM